MEVPYILFQVSPVSAYVLLPGEHVALQVTFRLPSSSHTSHTYMLQGVLYSVIVYAMVGYDWTPGKFFWFL